MKNTVQVYGITLEVEYDYYKGEPSTNTKTNIRIHEIFCNGINMSELTSTSVDELIKEKLIELNN
jgi:hypothetical protein